MDHNLNLLKSSTHTETQSFIDLNFDHYLFPCITRPTRITKTSATLIDNTFISQKLHNSFDTCIVVHDLSDHLPSIINLHDQLSKVSGHIEFKCRSLNKNKLESINKKLLGIDWTNLNNSNVNIALDEFQSKLEECLDSIAPLKIKKIPLHKIWHEQWITKGISNSMRKCTQLYKQSIKINSSSNTLYKYKYKLEKSIYKRLYNFISKNNIFYSKQYGFRSNHSCEQAIQDLYGQLINSKEEGLKSIAVFLDLSKVFDTLPHELLLKKTKHLWYKRPL